MWYTPDKDSSLVPRSLGTVRWAGFSSPFYVLCDAHSMAGKVIMSWRSLVFLLFSQPYRSLLAAFTSVLSPYI